jgi:FkbM family methyltransferase
MNKQLVSYAQNFEDVRLWRALRSVQQGYYIDIGAQSPIVDSVSCVFYQNGWRGAHVDAMQAYADELRDARPGDIVINAAVAAEPGALTFYEIAETGLSTTRFEIAQRHRAEGFAVHETTVQAITLDDVFDRVGERDVHWLKVDVEGGEQDLLQGWRQSVTRPWIVVIESTLPLTDQEAFEPWEHLILDKGYKFAHFDGLNRYYVSELHQDLAQSFAVPPNIFDDFALSMTSSTPLKREFVRKIDELHEAFTAENAARTEEKREFEKRLEESHAALIAEDAARTEEKRESAKRLEESHAALIAEEAARAEERREFARRLEESHAALIAGITARAEEARRRDEAIASMRAEVEDARTELAKSHEALSLNKQELVTQLRHSLWLKSELDENLSFVAEYRRKLEASKSNIKALQQDLGVTKVKLQEHADIAHRWWVTAEGMRAELEQIHASHSWKLTAGLRYARRILGPRRLALAIYVGAKSAIRPIALRSLLRLASNPRKRRLGRVILGVSPRLRERLRQSVLNEIAQTATVVPDRESQVSTLSPRRKQSGELLGVRATKVLDDLQKAIEKMQGKTL